VRALQAAARRQHAEEEKARKAAERAEKASARKALQEAKLAESQAKKAAKLASKAVAISKAPIQRRTVKVVEKTDHGVACRTKVVAGQTNRGRAIIVPRRSL
jgi:sRNA-binding protein